MSASTVVRQPAGVPVGGQFAVGAHAEPDGLALVPDDVDEPPALPCYDIPSARLHDAIAKIDTANRKLERAGIENRFTYQTQEYLQKSTRDAYGYPQVSYELRTKLTLSEPEVAYNGWEFVAALDATEHGFIARTAPGQDLEGWRPDAQECDHCGKARHRNSTYIVKNAAGERKQIGSNCLEPFLGVKPKGLWALEWDLDMEEPGEQDDYDAGGSGGGSDAIPVRDLIATALAVSDGGKGFLSRAKAMEWEKTSTADATNSHLFDRSRTEREARERAEAEVAAAGYLKDGTVDAVIAAAQAAEGDGDYVTNLKTALAGEWVGRQHAAIAISAIGVWRRGQERAAEKATITKGFAAPVDAKITGIAATVKKVSYHENPYDYNGGVNTLVIFQTPDGHQVKWFASGRKDFEVGQVGTFSGGTVKAHDEYRGVDQTVVTRVKFEPVSAPADPAHP